jgi:ribosomal protein L34E
VTIRYGANGPDVACHDCGNPLIPTGRATAREWFMLHDHVWDQTGMAPLGGCLCIACTERRLGRALTWRDLTDERPINEPNEADSPRMHTLKLAAATHRPGP